MEFDSKIIDDYIKAIDYFNFQDFCDRLLLTLFPEEYTPVRAGGPKGDMKNDGYCYSSRIFFQAHATRGESASRTKLKIKEDLEGCLENWKEVKKFIYITNDTLTGEIENFVDSLRYEYNDLSIETWGHKKLSKKIGNLKVPQIEYIIDRKIIHEVSFSDSELISTKYLITSEFDFIKEVLEKNFSNFPFEKPYLVENKVFKFLVGLLKNQSCRDTEIDNFLDIEKDQYTELHPDASLVQNNNEYRFFYHTRTPQKEELKEVTKDDNISQFLLTNQISEADISNILTYYKENECGGPSGFEELYQLRPFYIQLLVVKNISKKHINLKGLESIYHDGILYESNVIEENYYNDLPELLLEPSQNIIIPIGAFLSQIEDLRKLESNIVTSIYVPNQIQHLELGIIEENQEIEFVGPRLEPKKIVLENKKQKSNIDIHEFSFDKVYWLDRHWQCGSCPHLFFVMNNELKYQGEIFSDKPNLYLTEKIIIPNLVNELIIAELEQEITTIDFIDRNSLLVANNIILSEGQYLSICVSPRDTIEIKGKYEVNHFSKKTLPIMEKYKLIENFKRNYHYFTPCLHGVE